MIFRNSERHQWPNLRCATTKKSIVLLISVTSQAMRQLHILRQTLNYTHVARLRLTRAWWSLMSRCFRPRKTKTHSFHRQRKLGHLRISSCKATYCSEVMRSQQLSRRSFRRWRSQKSVAATQLTLWSMTNCVAKSCNEAQQPSKLACSDVSVVLVRRMQSAVTATTMSQQTL